MKAASAEKNTKPSMKRKLKRKVGYADEGVSITRMRLSELQIGERSEVASGRNIEEINKEASGEELNE